jgi:hypothetical protein
MFILGSYPVDVFLPVNTSTKIALSSKDQRPTMNGGACAACSLDLGIRFQRLGDTHAMISTFIRSCNVLRIGGNTNEPAHERHQMSTHVLRVHGSSNQ